MNRIQEIQIIMRAYYDQFVVFRDSMDVEYNFTGRRYAPSLSALEMLRRIARGMQADIDFYAGLITLTRRELEPALETELATERVANETNAVKVYELGKRVAELEAYLQQKETL